MAMKFLSWDVRLSQLNNYSRSAVKSLMEFVEGFQEFFGNVMVKVVEKGLRKDENANGTSMVERRGCLPNLPAQLL